MIKIRNYPAKNGDAFLIKASVKPFVMLVDGGYAETFQRHIKPDLEEIGSSGGVLDLVVASHIDADHISGLLSFFRLNGSAKSPDIIYVKEVLHNSLLSLVEPATEHGTTRSDDLEILGEIRRRGFPLPNMGDSAARQISARQGSSLSQLLQEGGYQWNTGIGTFPIGGNGLGELEVSPAKITVLGPNNDRLDALRNWWISEIRRLGLIGPLANLGDVFEFLCAHEGCYPGNQLLASSETDLAAAYSSDNSVTNGSSISLILEIEGLRLLFLGDSWAEDMVSALTPNGPTIFDAVKISHHGSARNTSVDLLTLVDSPHFFISTDGSGHGHPDYAVLKAIVDRPSDFRRTLHFNYSTPASRKLRAYQIESRIDFVVDEEQTDWVTIDRTNVK